MAFGLLTCRRGTAAASDRGGQIQVAALEGKWLTRMGRIAKKSNTAGTPLSQSVHARTLPIGAEPIAAGGVNFRVGAPEAPGCRRRARGRSGSARGMLARGRRRGLFLRNRPVGRPGDAIPLPARRPRRRALTRSRLAIPARRTRGSVRGRRPVGVPVDRSRLARRGVDRGAGDLRAARRHVHARGNLGGRGGTARRTWPTSGSRSWRSCPWRSSGGNFGWGYDGVNLFAPFHGYGISR